MEMNLDIERSAELSNLTAGMSRVLQGTLTQELPVEIMRYCAIAVADLLALSQMLDQYQEELKSKLPKRPGRKSSQPD